MNNSYPTTPRAPTVKQTTPIRLSTQKSNRKQPSRNKRGKKRTTSSSEEAESDYSEDDYE